MAENISVYMVREHLDDIPQYDLPPYTIRPYQLGDEVAWMRIQSEADKYNSITPALFTQQFGSNPKILVERQFFLCDAAGEAIGTATAWFDTYRGQLYGLVHWVAIVPQQQGRGLAKPLLTAVCNRLRDLQHERAFLITGTARIPAIKLYLKFGFVPDIKSEQDAEAWRTIKQSLETYKTKAWVCSDLGEDIMFE